LNDVWWVLEEEGDCQLPSRAFKQVSLQLPHHFEAGKDKEKKKKKKKRFERVSIKKTVHFIQLY
jgi:hypothetical protein